MLAALLLRPRVKGVFQALPWPAFVAAGGWAGYAFLGPQLLKVSQTAGLQLDSPWVSIELLADLIGMTAGAIAGYVASGVLNRLFGWTFYLFNKAFDASTSLYTKMVGGLLRVSVLVLFIYGGLLGLTYWSFTHTPTGFIPPQDKGYLLLNVQLPDSSSLERTQEVMKQIEQTAGKLPGVAHTVAIAGQSILLNANAPNFGAMYVMLDEFHHRATHGLSGPVNCRPASETSCKRKVARERSTSLKRRRLMAWGLRAGSRSWFRIAVTWGFRPSRSRQQNRKRQSRERNTQGAANAIYQLSSKHTVA